MIAPDKLFSQIVVNNSIVRTGLAPIQVLDIATNTVHLKRCSTPVCMELHLLLSKAEGFDEEENSETSPQDPNPLSSSCNPILSMQYERLVARLIETTTPPIVNQSYIIYFRDIKELNESFDRTLHQISPLDD
jgi:hypothetical protein